MSVGIDTADIAINERSMMVKSAHLFRSLAYVEHLKLVGGLPKLLPAQDMIDPQPPRQTRSLSGAPNDKRIELLPSSTAHASRKSMSPAQTTRKNESPATRRNSSPASNTGSGGKLTPPDVLRPLEIQSPNTLNLQLPPTCGAKQLAKLKRFLTTLQQFGSDISAEIGERVRALVLALVNSQMSIEDFHSKLQETTNFPLKPFVIPFLKATLPSLQRELRQCAQMSRQTPQQYLSNNERVIFDTSMMANARAGSVSSLSPEFRDDSSLSNKRKLSPKFSSGTGDIPPPKRLLRDSSPRSPPHTTLNDSEPGLLSTAENKIFTDKDLLPSPAQIKLEDINRMFRSRLDNVDISSSSNYPASAVKDDSSPDSAAREEKTWNSVECMLGDMANLMEKTKSAIATLQESRVKESQEFSFWMRKHAEGVDQDYKKRTGEIMSQTLKQSEDKIAEIKRRADETVSEVKRQAMVEIHRAVSAAEVKANELVNQEKARMEGVLSHMKKTAKEEAIRAVNKQVESPENCWNCGRRASETCSGCNQARYCGQFCQHKDWNRHHSSCGEIKEKNGDKELITSTNTIETKKEKTT